MERQKHSKNVFEIFSAAIAAAVAVAIIKTNKSCKIHDQIECLSSLFFSFNLKQFTCHGLFWPYKGKTISH